MKCYWCSLWPAKFRSLLLEVDYVADVGFVRHLKIQPVCAPCVVDPLLERHFITIERIEE